MYKPIDKAVTYFVQLIEKEPPAFCLLPTRNMVDEFNRAIMSKLNCTTMEINAFDEIDCNIKRMRKNA